MSGSGAQHAKVAHVFCNGELKDRAQAKTAAVSSDLLIAADGGAQHVAALGLKPKAIVGDMDSIGTETWRRDESIARVTYPPDKDRSDAELAIEYAFAQGCQQVSLVAAVGGRLDHTLGNIALVAKYPGRVAIVDGHFTLVAVNSSEKCVLRGRVGSAVSLIPYGPDQVRVTTRGLKYSIKNKPLAFATHGLSNELCEAEACVCVSGGVLLVCIETADDGPDGTRPGTGGPVK